MSGPFAMRFNGLDASTLSGAGFAAGRALQYGDGIFRTLLKFDGQLIDIDRQLEKLANDAARLGLQSPSIGQLHDDIEAAAGDRPTATLKIVVSRSGQARGYRSTESRVDRLLLAYEAPRYPGVHWSCGIVAFRSKIRMGSQPALAGIKHLNRLEQVLAARDWQDGADEGILCAAAGEPVCGTRSNLFWVDGSGGLHTPATDRCGVAGMMRDRVIEAARAAGLTLQIETRPWNELMIADEAFVTNSLIGLWPLQTLGDRRWNAPGPVTSNLAGRLNHPRLVRG